MLEKAWAKLHGSYERIEAGDTVNTIRDLVGAPGDSYNLRIKDEYEGLQWRITDGCLRAKWVITVSIDDKDPQEAARLKDIGLVPGHAYSLLNVAVVSPELTLLKIRNPWGNFEWNGDWGDNSDLWTDELKERCGWTNEDDGCFWMSWEDF